MNRFFAVLSLCLVGLVQADKQPETQKGIPGGLTRISNITSLVNNYQSAIEAYYNKTSTHSDYAYISKIYSAYSQVVSGKRPIYSWPLCVIAKLP